MYVAKLQSDGEPAYEPAVNRIRPSRVIVFLLRAHTRRKTLLTALQVLQVYSSIQSSDMGTAQNTAFLEYSTVLYPILYSLLT